jgi:GldM C-terminal domain
LIAKGAGMKNRVIAIMGICIAVLAILYFNKGEQTYSSTFKSLEAYFDQTSIELGNSIKGQIDDRLITHPKHDKEKTAPYLAKAEKIDAIVAKFLNSISLIKGSITKEGGNKMAVKKVMLDGGLGNALKNQIDSIIHLFLGSVRPEYRSTYQKLMSDRYLTTFAEDKAWEKTHFNNVAADFAQMELSRIGHDVVQVQCLITTEIIQEANSGCVFKFDPYFALAWSPDGPYVNTGGHYNVSIMLLKRPEDERKIKSIKAFGKELKSENNMGRYSTTATTEGVKVITGTLVSSDADGNENGHYPFKNEYLVVKPQALIAADNMRILYAGITNPVSVSAAFVLPENLVVTASKGTITGTKGKYLITVSEPGTVTIRVAAKNTSQGAHIIDSTVFTVIAKP